jgi:uncharacterized OsmC-like protein
MRITSKLLEGMQFESDIRGHKVTVDAPVEAGGVNAGPLPPELLVASLGTCIGIYAALFCRKHQISTEGLTVHTDWEKEADPSRVGKIAVIIDLPAGIPDAKRGAFMKTVEQCMVHNTLCQMPVVSVEVSKG